MKPNIGIIDTDRHEVAVQLNKLLADEYVLYTKTKNAHWNIEGEDFYFKHQLFETQFEMLDTIIDQVAERIRTIGQYANASLAMFLKTTHLTEQSRTDNNSEGFISELLVDHECIIFFLRENISKFTNELNDVGSSDFATGLLAEHEKMAWFLRSHLH